MATKIWQRDSGVLHARAAQEDDIEELNHLFSDAFTDRYRRDGLVGVRVPQLNPEIWRYAIRDAAVGAFLWFDEDSIIAFNMAHASGTEGWMGPLAVRVGEQGRGLGKMIVGHAVEWLKDRGARTIGLETMPRTVDNIGFYGRLGFVPDTMTITMTADLTESVADRPMRLLSEEATTSDFLSRCRERLQQSQPGVDYSREFELSVDLGIGDGALIEDGGGVRAFALWHDAPLASGKWDGELRVLKMFADSVDSMAAIVEVAESVAWRRGIRRVSFRCQTDFSGAFGLLVQRDYMVRWTDLRMTVKGYRQQALPAGEILFSNWEI